MKLSLQKLKLNFAKKQNIPALKHIWKVCFGDSEVDITSFFDNAYTENTTLFAEYDDKPAGMLTMLPCTIKTPLRNYSGYYFYAIAVMPEYRGGGIMRELETFACDIIKGDGADFSCLVPANEPLFSAYSKLGYTLFSRVADLEITLSDSQVNIKYLPLKFPEFAELRGAYLGEFRNSIRFTENYEKFAYYDYLRAGGKIFQESGRGGYICAHKVKGTLQITETSLTLHELQDMAKALREYTGARRLVARMPGSQRGFAMIKTLAEDEMIGLNTGAALLATNYFGFALD